MIKYITEEILNNPISIGNLNGGRLGSIHNRDTGKSLLSPTLTPLEITDDIILRDASSLFDWGADNFSVSIHFISLNSDISGEFIYEMLHREESIEYIDCYVKTDFFEMTRDDDDKTRDENIEMFDLSRNPSSRFFVVHRRLSAIIKSSF